MRGPAWIEVDWNSIWLRVQSHMTSHYTRGSVTTVHDFGGVVGRPLDTFFWALTISWPRLLAHVWSGPQFRRWTVQWAWRCWSYVVYLTSIICIDVDHNCFLLWNYLHITTTTFVLWHCLSSICHMTEAIDVHKWWDPHNGYVLGLGVVPSTKWIRKRIWIQINCGLAWLNTNDHFKLWFPSVCSIFGSLGLVDVEAQLKKAQILRQNCHIVDSATFE